VYQRNTQLLLLVLLLQNVWRGKSTSITITPTIAKEFKKLYKHQLEFKLLLGREHQDLGLVFAQKNGKPIQPKNGKDVS
jgi:hypothetical protein